MQLMKGLRSVHQDRRRQLKKNSLTVCNMRPQCWPPIKLEGIRRLCYASCPSRLYLSQR